MSYQAHGQAARGISRVAPSAVSRRRSRGARPAGLNARRWNESMPRFVILTHDHPFLHWDLLLESGAVLRAWRLLAEPLSAEIIAAEPLPDHRKPYLDYEGPVSGDRGSVARWDAGTFEIPPAVPSDARQSDPAERIAIDFAGERLRGRFVLERGREGSWRLHSPPASPCE